MSELTILYRTAIYTYGASIGLCYEAGMVATFTGVDRQVTICTPGSMPIGFFVTSIYHSSFSPMLNSGKVGIAVGQGEYQVDAYEDGVYRVNDLLYCSPRGLVTNKKTLKNQATVGIVNYVCPEPPERIGFISCFTNIEYCKF